ncbi:MAG: DUF2628 domain-containing protein [Acidobacteriota bacterium]
MKSGWNWPAFLFGLAWALVKRMWLLALGLFLFAVLMGLFVAGIRETSDPDVLLAVRVIFNLIGLGIGIWLGLNGNRLREERLKSLGFGFQEVSTATSAQDAEKAFRLRNNWPIE